MLARAMRAQQPARRPALLLLGLLLQLPWPPAHAASGGCGPGGVAPGDDKPYACTSTAAELPNGVKLFYSVDNAAGLLRCALQTPGRGWVSLVWTTADNARSSARTLACCLAAVKV
jgi:hypothetical protein